QVEAMTLASRVAVFEGELLQQVGPPLELYHRPANRFVAQFLGSPAMNVFSAERAGSELMGKGFRLTAPADLRAGGPVLVGLRPQDLTVAAEGPLRGSVVSIERLGFDGYAYLSTEGGALAARFTGALEVGASVRVAMTGDALHVFSSDGMT